jgi:hypothetical protein
VNTKSCSTNQTIQALRLSTRRRKQKTGRIVLQAVPMGTTMQATNRSSRARIDHARPFFGRKSLLHYAAPAPAHAKYPPQGTMDSDPLAESCAIVRGASGLTLKLRRNSSAPATSLNPGENLLPDAALPKRPTLLPGAARSVQIRLPESNSTQSGACGAPPCRAYPALPEMWPSG